MTSADRSTPLDTSCISCMLPITSAQPAPTSALHPSGRFQVSTYHGNHRRRPPENTVSLVHAHRHGSQGPTHLAMHTPTADEVHGSGIGVKSSLPPIALTPGSLSAVDGQPLQINFSGGSGDSSSAEGRCATSRHSSKCRSTQKSTAQDWFNSLNREVGGNGTYDNDSPYYMPNHRRRKYPQASRNSRSLKSQHGATAESSDQGFGMPAAVGMRGDSTEGSNNSDSFRSVIDDLTIKNQKLKKRLRKLENLHGRNAPAERLFEVRVHDLPESKKLELERLLQNFTASLCSEGALDPGSNSLTPGDLSSIVDSGYASVSRYGNDSTHESRNSGGRAWPLSQSNSEITKMTLVVGKLEQLFTGRKRIAADRSMLLQQQDISNVAAANDQVAIACAGEHSRAEGFRAASFEDPDSGSDVIDSSDSTDPLAEQRPTRPLDLDPQREQVAEENIEYLTHMTESSTRGPETSDGWVYLNLIINLAQLHTINVTPPFVRKAITAASTKLELSPDGKMVRWKGGQEGTHFSNTNSSLGNGGDDSSEQSPQGGDGKKNELMSRSGYGSGSGADSGSGATGLVLKTTSSEHRFHYKPLFGRSQSSDDDSSSCVASSEGESPKRSSDSDSKGVEKDSGPIIFYKGGAFCTDLSSQELRDDDRDDHSPQIRYVRATARPLGCAQWEPEPWSCKRNSPLCLASTIGLITPEDSVMRVDDGDGDMLIQFSPQFTATSSVTTPPEPIEFEASGLGGVLPADNFAINCQTRHYILPDYGRLPMPKAKALKDRLHKKILHRIPKASIDAFYDQDNMTDSSVESTASHELSSERLLRHEILSAQTLKLAPSRLPPASYIFASPSEDSSSCDETDSDNAPRSLGPIGDVDFQAATPFDTYRISSSDENECAFERSPSSAATTGHGSNPFSITGFGAEDSTFDESIPADQFKSVEGACVPPVDVSAVAGSPRQPLSGFDLERPQLKRSRGSAVSSGSTDQIKKSVRLETSSD